MVERKAFGAPTKAACSSWLFIVKYTQLPSYNKNKMSDKEPNHSFVDPDTGAHYDHTSRTYYDPDGFMHKGNDGRGLEYQEAFNLNESFRERNRKVADKAATDLVEGVDEQELRDVKLDKNKELNIAGLRLKLEPDLHFVDAYETADRKTGYIEVKSRTRLYGEQSGTFTVEDGKISEGFLKSDEDSENLDLYFDLDGYEEDGKHIINISEKSEDVSGSFDVPLFKNKQAKNPVLKEYSVDVPDNFEVSFTPDANYGGGTLFFRAKEGKYESLYGSVSIEDDGKLKLYVEDSDEETERFLDSYDVKLGKEKITVVPK